MPPREATLAGVPTIATEWLGLGDVAAWGYPIRVKELRPTQYDHEEANAKDSLWAEPDFENLCEKMQQVYEDYDHARNVALMGRWHIQNVNDWRKVAGRIIEAMETHA